MHVCTLNVTSPTIVIKEDNTVPEIQIGTTDAYFIAISKRQITVRGGLQCSLTRLQA